MLIDPSDLDSVMDDKPFIPTILIGQYRLYTDA